MSQPVLPDVASVGKRFLTLLYWSILIQIGTGREIRPKPVSSWSVSVGGWVVGLVLDRGKHALYSRV